MKISVPGFIWNNTGEVLETYTWHRTFSVEYPIGTTPKQFLFSGSATLNAIPKIGTYVSDELPISIPAGAAYNIRSWGQIVDLRPPTATFTVSGGAITSTNITDGGLNLNISGATALSATVSGAGAGTGGALTPTVSGGVLTVLGFTAGSGYTDGTYSVVFAGGAKWLNGRAGRTELGEASRRGLNLADVTLLTSTPTHVAGTGGYAPYGIFGKQTTRATAIGILGDSIVDGTADGAFVDGNIGYVERSLGSAVGWINTSTGGTTSEMYNSGRGEESDYLGAITHLYNGLINNDIYTGASTATIKSRLQSLWAPYLAKGIKVYQVLGTPRSSSTDGFTTVVNQTLINVSNNTIRVALNDWLRDNWASLGLTGIIDTCSVLESSLNSGLWAATGGANTADGIHPNTNGHQRCVDAGIAAPGIFT